MQQAGEHDKPVRYELTLEPDTAKKLLALRLQSMRPSGRMKTNAAIVRELIMAAPLNEAAP